MTEIDKKYVERQINQAKATDNPNLKNNYLYRAGTQMEVIECDGNDNLSSEQQEMILKEASKLLLGK
jgi:hypothetical protein